MKVELLIQFRSKGLTPALLKNLNIPRNVGGHYQYQRTFTHFMQRRNMTPVEVIQELDGLTYEQLTRMREHNETRAQMLDVHLL